LTIADFWIGGIYTNFINYKEITYAKDKWPTCLDKYPHFKAYGERFSQAMKVRLDYRTPITDVSDILSYKIKNIDGKDLGTIG
jgi:hypothetical protein